MGGKKGRIALSQMVTQSAERLILPITLSLEDKTVVPEWLRGVSRISVRLNHRLRFACGVLICFWTFCVLSLIIGEVDPCLVSEVHTLVERGVVQPDYLVGYLGHNPSGVAECSYIIYT